MSDQERELTPEQEAKVRRLLAEARAAEPVPTDVAARLDRVLVGLGEERGIPARPLGRPVAPDWRRRRATGLLIAAAAVVAIGVGVGQIDGMQGAGSDDSGASEVSGLASRDEAGANAAGGEANDEDGTVKAPSDAQSALPESADQAPTPTTATPVGRVREGSFTADANQLRRAFPDNPVDGEFVRLDGDQLPAGYVSARRAFDCGAASWGPGVLVPVYFDGLPAVLAYRPAIGESQIVELLQCGTGDALRSTTLQAG